MIRVEATYPRTTPDGVVRQAVRLFCESLPRRGDRIAHSFYDSEVREYEVEAVVWRSEPNGMRPRLHLIPRERAQ